MQTSSTPELEERSESWEPLTDIPDNLASDERNYIEWVCSLIDDGIHLDEKKHFSRYSEPIAASRC